MPTNPKDPPQTRAMHRAADRHLPAIRQLVVETIETARARVTFDKVRELMGRGDFQGIVGLVDFDGIAKSKPDAGNLNSVDPNSSLAKAIDPEALQPYPYETTRLETVLIDVLRDGALAAAPFGPGPDKAATLALGFDVTNPYAVRWARQNAARLVRLIDDDGRRTIRRVLADALRHGGHPTQTAREIADVVGLTERQAVAVINYRRALEDARTSGRSGAGLRSRFTLATARGRITSQEQVDRLVSRYAQRQLRKRALTIARTETLASANEGARSLVQAMGNRGLFDPMLARRVWSTSKLEVCPICEGLEGTEVGFYETFNRGEPPIHPRCKCVIRTVHLSPDGARRRQTG